MAPSFSCRACCSAVNELADGTGTGTVKLIDELACWKILWNVRRFEDAKEDYSRGEFRELEALEVVVGRNFSIGSISMISR